MNRNALTIKEAMQLLGVSRQTLYTWMDKGLAYNQIGHFRLISINDLRNYKKNIKKKSHRKGKNV